MQDGIMTLRNASTAERDMSKKKDYTGLIDEKFHKATMTKPRAGTVKQLIEILSQLPGDLPVDKEQRDLVVFNVAGQNSGAHLSFTEDN